MARPRQQTTIQLPPRIKSFTPSGYYAGEAGQITLNVEEYECIRLLDYEGLSQVEAAGYMAVSRPTLTRIYERARIKMASALVEAKQLLIEGGCVQYNGCWGRCTRCQSRYCTGESIPADTCPLCGGAEAENEGSTASRDTSRHDRIRAAIPIDNDGADPQLYAKFARSPFFAIVDIAEGATSIVGNPFAGNEQGLGASVAEYLTVEHRANLFVAYELGLQMQTIAHKRGIGQVILHTEIHSLSRLKDILKNKNN